MEDIRTGVCPRCRHDEIVEAPFKHSIGGGRRVVYVAPAAEAGMLMIYACRRCGHFELFVSDCDAVPIGPEYETRLIKGTAPAGPYR